VKTLEKRTGFMVVVASDGAIRGAAAHLAGRADARTRTVKFVACVRSGNDPVYVSRGLKTADG